jgi:hypothetical protein
MFVRFSFQLVLFNSDCIAAAVEESLAKKLKEEEEELNRKFATAIKTIETEKSRNHQIEHACLGMFSCLFELDSISFIAYIFFKIFFYIYLFIF